MSKGVSLERMIDRMPPNRREKVEKRGRELVNEEMTRRAIRQARGETQASIAAKLGIKQENVSRIEQRADIMLSTLNDYLASMGGKLSLIAEFEGRDPVKIVGFGEVSQARVGVKRKSKDAAG